MCGSASSGVGISGWLLAKKNSNKQKNLMVQELDFENLHAVKETLEALRLEEAQVDEELKAFLEAPAFPDLESVRFHFEVEKLMRGML